MRNLLVVIIIVFFISLFQSCYTLHCKDLGTSFDVLSKDSAALSLVYLKSYNPGSNFDENSLVKSDTINHINKLSYIEIKTPYFSNYDWLIILPNAKLTYRITETQLTNLTEKRGANSGGSEKCFTKAKCKIDGVEHIAEDRSFRIDTGL